jgi:transposase
VTHWSSRLPGGRLKVSNATVARAWREYGVQPWRAETFKFSTDPELVAKVTDVVGLYLAPPQDVVVLCVDEKSQIQALDRTAPMLPLQPGLPARRTHDYVRHGTTTTTLFAALEIATGKVTAICQPRHRHQEFLRFLRQVARAYPEADLHLVMDNYAAHKHPAVRAWLAAHPRITVHFTPTSASWMNLVEVWFAGRRTPGHPPRQLPQRPRPHYQDPGLHRRLERPPPPLHLDQDRRPDPCQSPPSKDFKHGPLDAYGANSRPVREHVSREESIHPGGYGADNLSNWSRTRPTLCPPLAPHVPRSSLWMSGWPRLRRRLHRKAFT